MQTMKGNGYLKTLRTNARVSTSIADSLLRHLQALKFHVLGMNSPQIFKGNQDANRVRVFIADATPTNKSAICSMIGYKKPFISFFTALTSVFRHKSSTSKKLTHRTCDSSDDTQLRIHFFEFSFENIIWLWVEFYARSAIIAAVSKILLPLTDYKTLSFLLTLWAIWPSVPMLKEVYYLMKEPYNREKIGEDDV